MPKLSPEYIFGREVRRIRNSVGISQEELSFRANVHRTYISQIERGQKSPTLGVILRIAASLQTPASEIVGIVEKAAIRS